jgi:hypothetical protein
MPNARHVDLKWNSPNTGLKPVRFRQPILSCPSVIAYAMRRANSQDFEHYLEKIPPCSNDYEVPERASLEMEIKYFGRMFCFHIPAQQAQDWGVEMTALERKTWIPAKEFNHMRFAPVFDEIRALLGLLT